MVLCRLQFHDVLIENLSGTATWRSSHVVPADMTSLRRRWPKAVYNTLQCRAPDVERLRRDAPKRADKAFHYGGPGFCGVCDTRIYSALDAHMIAYHLELAQLWRCPVTWCAVWNRSGRACLEHLAEKTRRIDAGRHDQSCQFFFPMDGNSGSLARCPPSGRIRGRLERPAVPRGRTPVGSSVSGL